MATKFPYKHIVNIKFPSNQAAEHVRDILLVDEEPPTRTRPTSKKIETENSVLRVEIAAADWDSLRRKSNSLYDNLSLILETIDAFHEDFNLTEKC